MVRTYALVGWHFVGLSLNPIEAPSPTRDAMIGEEGVVKWRRQQVVVVMRLLV